VEGVKYDIDKPRFDLIPSEPLEDVAKVLAMGAKKYSPNNWMLVPLAKTRYIAAAIRHVWSRLSGEVIDSESGLPHTAHAICCLLFLGWFDYRPRTKNKRVYISGPITGIPELNKPAFMKAENELRSLGYNPINPFNVSVVSKHKYWHDYMREDIKALMDVDCVLAIDGWGNSNGAVEEIRICNNIGIPVYTSIKELLDKTGGKNELG